jgi:AcrR family transcriptional regulator
MKKAKGTATKARIVEAATICLGSLGDRGTTFQSIADQCGVSQALVIKYLGSRDNIFPVVLMHWIERARQETERSLLPVGSPTARLRDYIRVSIFLFLERVEISKIYMILHYYALVDAKYRLINTQIKDVATKRIAEILEDGVKEGVFTVADAQTTAKTIHNALVGFLLSSVTESKKPSHLDLPRALDELIFSYVLKSGSDRLR